MIDYGWEKGEGVGGGLYVLMVDVDDWLPKKKKMKINKPNNWMGWDDEGERGLSLSLS